MQAFYADHFVLPLPPGHRFPMAKYALLRDALILACPELELQEAPACSDEELLLVHSGAYVDAVRHGRLSEDQQRAIGFPWSAAMAERSRRSVGGTVAAAFAALQDGMAANLAGGTHHAYPDSGSGFCVFNDLAVAARGAQALWGQSHSTALPVLIVDLDVHQGNGTAHIFADDASVFTLSVHGENNFPFRKEHSDLDVALPDGCDDALYLLALSDALAEVEQRFSPGLVLYQAGVDPSELDRLGRLKLSAAGLQQRDRMVFEWCETHRYPVALTMGGGYANRIEDTVQLQVNTYREALRCWRRWHNLAP